MPGYIFANKEKRGTSTINYRIEQRGERWWYERTVVITRPNSTDEISSQWFGSYDSESECQERVDSAKKLDQTYSEL